MNAPRNHTARPRFARAALHRTPADPGAPGSAARIAELRRQIAAGTYLTQDKLDAAIEALHAALLPESPQARGTGPEPAVA